MALRSSAWIALLITSTFFLFEFVARVEPSLATTEIAARYGLSHAGVGTLSSLFFWIYAPMQLIVGLLLDRYGARKMIVPAILVCAVGVLVFASSTNLWLAAMGRLLVGLGASFGFVGALYVVNHRFAANRFAVLSGLVTTVGMLGTALGTIALSATIDRHGSRDVFLATGAVGIILFALAFVFLHDAKPGAHQRADTAISDSLKTLFGNRRLWLIALAGALYYMPVNVFGGLWGQSDLTVDHHLNAIEAQLAVSMLFWGVAIGSIAAGAVSDWLGHRKWLIISNALLAGCAYAGAIYWHNDSQWALSLLLFLAGFFGGAQILTFSMAKQGAPMSLSGTIIAFVNMIGIAGAIVFQPLVGILLDASGNRFGVALATIPVCLLMSAIIMLMVDEQPSGG